MLDIKKSTFMTDSQIREACPSIFTSEPSGDVTKLYTHIPTSRVIEDMEKLGWRVVDAKQVNARKNNTIGFQKHMVVFRNPDVQIDQDNDDPVFPQILVSNSHNGKNSFVFRAGLYRAVCENGLVVSTQEFESMKIRHLGYSFENLQEKIKEMVEKLPLTIETMKKMKEINLTDEQAEDFAKRAISTRFTDEEIDSLQIDIETLLRPARKEDEGDDLWTIFNVLQEKMIEGGFEYTFKEKRRKAREIKSFIQDQKINENLFELAMEYAN